MNDWDGIITEALKELQADAIFTRGAILHNKVSQIARRSGFDFDHHLKETNQKFSSAVQKVENIEIYKRPNTDMYVGLVGATWPESASERPTRNINRIRADVYEAFTRISDSEYWYLPDADEFSKDIAQDYTHRKIAVPSATLDDLLKQRRNFAETSEAHEDLKRAIERSPNPLAAFQAEVSRLRLGQAWHNYKSAILRKSVEEWAEQNEINFNPKWMESQDVGQNLQSPQRLMATFAAYMSDEEVRSISVPFRAVEAMYRNIVGSQR